MDYTQFVTEDNIAPVKHHQDDCINPDTSLAELYHMRRHYQKLLKAEKDSQARFTIGAQLGRVEQEIMKV